MTADFRASGAIALHDVDDTGGQADFMADFGKGNGGKWRQIGGLQHDGVTGCQSWCDLPCKHEKREIPRNDLTADANGRKALELIFHHLGPACMVIEVTGDERNVDVTGFADRLAVIHAFQHGQKTLALLNMARDGIEIFGALIARKFGPFAESGAGGIHRLIDIFRIAADDFSELVTIGRIGNRNCLAVFRFDKGPVDIVAERTAMLFQPQVHITVCFGGRSIFHGLQDVLDGSHFNFPYAAA